MLVIISMSRLDNDGVAIRVARPQRDSNPVQEYSSEEEARAVLSTFGISEEAISIHLTLLAQMGANQQLNFPPMDVPQHDLLAHGFRL
jgi:hypothetical protein